MSALTDFHFLRPPALLLLLALPLAWVMLRRARGDAGSWRGAVDAHLLPHLIERSDLRSSRGGFALAALAWTVATLAMAGPAWEREPMPLYRNQAARVLVLELAPSMLAQDEKPSRLARARYKISDILERSRDSQTALIGYAGAAFVAAPLTDDVGTVANLVEALDPSTMPVAGNATARAIELAVQLVEQAGLHGGEIILIADSASADATAAARKAHAAGMTVSVLGVGSANGAPVPLAQGDFLKDDSGNVIVSRRDEETLRRVAEVGGGRYADLAADARDLDSLLGRQVEGVDATDAGTSDAHAQSTRWRDRGAWLLLLLLPLALAGFRRGWLLLLPLTLLAPIPQANAASFADLWQRPDQQAAQALAQGDAKQAAVLARSPEWRGSAAYRAEDFEAAVAEYAGVHGADGAYNRGNALARLGRYEDAIAAYDEALQQQPDMADAQANRQAVQDFLKQSQQDSPSQQGQDPSRDDAGEKSPSGKQPGQSQDQDSKGEAGEQGEPQSQDAGKEPQKEGDEKSQDGEQSPDGQEDKPSDDGAADAQGGKPDAEQQQALSQAIDKALEQASPPGEHEGKAAVPQEDDATREKKQALEHWLRRVPDDPGGLLRRKFQLEYQRRQQRTGDNG